VRSGLAFGVAEGDRRGGRLATRHRHTDPAQRGGGGRLPRRRLRVGGFGGGNVVETYVPDRWSATPRYPISAEMDAQSGAAHLTSRTGSRRGGRHALRPERRTRARREPDAGARSAGRSL